jgi:hypothetical protein
MNLADLEAPPASPEFRSELQRRIETGERLARGRRRAAALVAVVAAVVIVSATSVSAFHEQTKPLDRTMTCAVPQTGGVYRVDLLARVRGPGTNFGGVVVPNRAEAAFNAGDTGPNNTSLASVVDFPNGFGFNDQLCHGAAAVPLARAGLPSVGSVTGTKGATIAKECWLAPVVTVRMHVTFGASGKPVSAKLVLRSGRRLRPAAYIDWTPTRASAFASAACNN